MITKPLQPGLILDRIQHHLGVNYLEAAVDGPDSTEDPSLDPAQLTALRNTMGPEWIQTLQQA